MRTLMLNALNALAATALAVASVQLAEANAAYASGSPVCHHVTQTTGPNNVILNGTAVNLPFDLGLDITGVALGLLGSATSSPAGDTVTCS